MVGLSTTLSPAPPSAREYRPRHSPVFRKGHEATEDADRKAFINGDISLKAVTK